MTESNQPGLYEKLLTKTMQSHLDQLADPRLYVTEKVDADDAHTVIAQFLEHALVTGLASFRGKETAERQKRVVDRILSILTDELGQDWGNHLNLSTPLRRLLAIHQTTELQFHQRPDTPLSRSALLTGARLDPSLGSQLKKEIATADSVDIVCSFIKWSGLRVILDELKALAERPFDNCPRIRVITTSYMGATDPKAIEELNKLPNTEIRISYDTKRTRLHAKAYVFHRDTEFGNAYVGSANLSNAALSEGVEWTTKISQYELSYLWGKITGTFETYWQDDEFNNFTESDAKRFREAINRERSSDLDSQISGSFDFHPYPFQEEILDVLKAERELQSKRRHLVVAATGTGKTMIAAFDYARVCREQNRQPSFLFIVHREEILKQALASFRAVLRDHNFGDLLVGGREPAQSTHLFCSIQSYNSHKLDQCAADTYEYVVVDEFHHAAAQSYRNLLDHIRPSILLGLTATPERSDQLDVLQWFDGRTSAEIRLPDAINRKLLCPFQYFGIADSVDLDGLTWQRGGYRLEQLDQIYTGNDVRAQLILDKTHQILLHPNQSRGLGFCVSKSHAEYMARYFNEGGVPAAALTADSSSDLRRAVQNQLRTRQINFIFVVDLYNEGVDIPEIDTLLFLRPTESMTIFLQQLGRGMRLHVEKECLTVLDFIGAQRREFQFAPRFRALSTKPVQQLTQEVELGFPHLPSGCVIQLERVAQQRVLENIKNTVRLIRPRMISSLRELGNTLGYVPTLADAIDYFDTNLDGLLKRGLWSSLLSEAGLIKPLKDPDQKQLAKGIRRLSHVDCVYQIEQWLQHIDQDEISKDKDSRLIEMLYVSLWGKQGLGWSISESRKRLLENRGAYQDLKGVLAYQRQKSLTHEAGRLPLVSGPLTIHAQYTRDEILIGLGHWSLNNRPDHREGVLHLKDSKVDAFFITLQKTESEYSPTTMYEDYLISHNLFHWQSQSNTSADSPTGQRYINHRSNGYTPILFVRETKKSESGLTTPYHYLGPCEYVSHTGSRPINIIWRLTYSVPAKIYRVMARQATG